MICHSLIHLVNFFSNDTTSWLRWRLANFEAASNFLFRTERFARRGQFLRRWHRSLEADSSVNIDWQRLRVRQSGCLLEQPSHFNSHPLKPRPPHHTSSRSLMAIVLFHFLSQSQCRDTRFCRDSTPTIITLIIRAVSQISIQPRSNKSHALSWNFKTLNIFPTSSNIFLFVARNLSHTLHNQCIDLHTVRHSTYNYITFLTSYLSVLPAEDEVTILDGTINRQCASVSKVAARLNNPVILPRPRCKLGQVEVGNVAKFKWRGDVPPPVNGYDKHPPEIAR